jgi:hypothetical protein
VKGYKLKQSASWCQNSVGVTLCGTGYKCLIPGKRGLRRALAGLCSNQGSLLRNSQEAPASVAGEFQPCVWLPSASAKGNSYGVAEVFPRGWL